MEPASAAMLVFGLAILVCSWIQLLVSAFNDDYTWGLCTVFLPPLSYFYGLFAWEKAREPIMLAVIGWVLIILS